MKTLLLYISGICLLCTNIQAQNPTKWGDVATDDLQMTTYANDPSAPAVVLSDYGRVTVGPRVEYFRHVRIKILKDQGKNFATIEIPYRSFDRYDQITQLQGQTFNINADGKVLKTKLKTSDMDELKTDEMHRRKVFTLPDVKAGSVIEYRYTIRSLDLVQPGNWYFQSVIPTRYSEYEINIPRNFDYLVTYSKGEQLTNTAQQDYAARIQWLYDRDIKDARRELYKQQDLLWESPSQRTRVYLNQGQTTRFKMKDVPAFKPEKGMEVFSDYYPSVKVHLYMVADNYRFFYRPALIAARMDYASYSRSELRYQNQFLGHIAYWLPTWDEANKAWLDQEEMGMRLVKEFNYQPILSEALNGATTASDSINGITNWVKQHVAWNGSFSVSSPHKLDHVLKKGNASSGEINLLLTALLQRAGFDAAPVLIRTRDLGKPENMYPAKDQFNHLLCTIRVNGRNLFRDAATTQNDKGELPWYVKNAQGWILKKNGFGWVEIEEISGIPKTEAQLLEI
ncbi:MAG TPA: DUF3857 and transglutaminase domain-containing protein [Bacteroidales bacterium]|nr:DUF3857 and transglutaminase domain-containing protein [Bacteroidales bacterium]